MYFCGFRINETLSFGKNEFDLIIQNKQIDIIELKTNTNRTISFPDKAIQLFIESKDIKILYGTVKIPGNIIKIVIGNDLDTILGNSICPTKKEKLERKVLER